MMSNVKLKLDLVCQVAVVVRDLDASLANFRKLVDIEDDSISRHDSLPAIEDGSLSPQIYKGVEEKYGYQQVNFFFGGMDIEMFAPIDDKPGNPMVDFLNEHGPGIHHLNIRLANRQEGIDFLQQDLGIVPLMECWSFGRHCAYFDMREQLGIVFEIGSRVVGPRAKMSAEEIEALCR
ncbi:MAG: hypothetical protein HFJ10_00460 [Lachnospiraceae bacterium]|jgi:hypothetical protein|nr:hypothetical protein [Lachnospiraceae bacterium]